MKKFVNIFCLLFLIMLTACGVNGHLTSYSPSNYAKQTGSISIGYFKYIPYERGLVSTRYEIETNMTLNSYYINYDVANYVKEATIKELEKSGVTISDDSDYVLAADILKLYYMSAGTDVIWSYSVRYKFMDKATNNIVYSKEYSPETLKRHIYSDPHISIPELILASYDMFIRDPEVIKYLTIKNKKKK